MRISDWSSDVCSSDLYGFRAIVAPSYADIFFNNSFKNGLLPIVLSELEISRLFDEVKAFSGYKLRIDLPRQVAIAPDGRELSFDKIGRASCREGVCQYV